MPWSVSKPEEDSKSRDTRFQRSVSLKQQRSDGNNNSNNSRWTFWRFLASIQSDTGSYLYGVNDMNVMCRGGSSPKILGGIAPSAPS